MKAKLIPLDGGEPVEILKDMTLVGRKEECDLPWTTRASRRCTASSSRRTGCCCCATWAAPTALESTAAHPPGRLVTQRPVDNRPFQIQGLPWARSRSGIPQDHTQHLDADEVVKLLRKRPLQSRKRSRCARPTRRYGPIPCRMSIRTTTRSIPMNDEEASAVPPILSCEK